MIKWLRQFFCRHDWRMGGYMILSWIDSPNEYNHIYCIKCNKPILFKNSGFIDNGK